MYKYKNKYCTKCNQDFTPTGGNSRYCVSCQAQVRLQQRRDKDKKRYFKRRNDPCYLEYQAKYRTDNYDKFQRQWKEWQINNREHSLFLSTCYKYRKNNQMPQWADKKKIADIYHNRPENYHVDHIIPLKGKNVCGLHVENNLQYLLAEENISKSNKFEDY